MTSKQSPPSEMKDLRYVREGDDEDWIDLVEQRNVELLNCRDRCARLAKALQNVPIFQSNGYTKTCTACGAQHWFDKGPPVVIRHKEGCWGAAILEFLAALSDTAQQESKPDWVAFAEKTGERRGMGLMRERAAKLARHFPLCTVGAQLADAIRALPIENTGDEQ